MSYNSIMVHVDQAPASSNRVRFAGALADRFGARLIGIAAAEPAIPIVGDGVYVDERLLREAEANARAALSEAETLFRKVVGSRNAVEWRSTCDRPSDFLVENARAADLIIVGRQGPGDHRDWQLGVTPGDILMDAGRPVMVVPPHAQLPLARVLVAWRNTREARRAVWDALPILEQAESVFLLGVGEGARHEGLSDVASWLERHGIPSTTRIIAQPADGASEEILVQVEEIKADVVVAGAYGHSRAREWIFGGVTCDLLREAPIPCLMTH
jgi:nucleotide-binding universal stress UspA family protein